MSIHLILKSIQGDFLAQISDVAGQVSIGSDAICDLQIPDDEVKSEQLRFSYLNGDLWLQVPDPSETVKIEDQNLREAKLTTSTVVFFKDYYIEVLFKTEETVGRGQTISTSITNSILTVDEATRVVDTSSEKTRIASSKDASAALQFNEATRVLNSNEATRVISTQEATRIVTTGAQPTPREKMKVSLSKTQGGSLSPSFQTTDFPIIFKKMATDLLGKIKWPPENAGNVGLGAGVAICMIFILFSLKKTRSEPQDLSALVQSPVREALLPTKSVDAQKRNIQSVSKDVYLQEFDRLFGKQK